MEAARSEPAELRPSLLPGRQRGQAHSAEMETQEASDSQGGAPRSRRPLQPLLLPPPEGRAIPLESPPADGLDPSPQEDENIWLINPDGSEGLDGDGKPVKCPSQVTGAPRGPGVPDGTYGLGGMPLISQQPRPHAPGRPPGRRRGLLWPSP